MKSKMSLIISISIVLVILMVLCVSFVAANDAVNIKNDENVSVPEELPETYNTSDYEEPAEINGEIPNDDARENDASVANDSENDTSQYQLYKGGYIISGSCGTMQYYLQGRLETDFADSTSVSSIVEGTTLREVCNLLGHWHSSGWFGRYYPYNLIWYLDNGQSLQIIFELSGESNNNAEAVGTLSPDIPGAKILTDEEADVELERRVFSAKAVYLRLGGEVQFDIRENG